MILLQLAGTTFIVFVTCLILNVINSGVVEDKAIQERVDKVLDNVCTMAVVSTILLLVLTLLAFIWGLY